MSLNRVLFFSLFVILFTDLAAAKEIVPLYRSARYSALGGACLATVEDEEAVFINPAGLAAPSPLIIKYLNLNLELSLDTVTAVTESIGAFRKFDSDSFDALMGKNAYGRAQFAPLFRMPYFGIGLITDGQVAFYTANKAMPQMTIGYQTTNGVQAGFGYSLLGKGGRRSRRTVQPDWRVGLAGKVLWRRGGYREFLPLDLLRLSGDKDAFKELFGGYEMGYGVDLGTQYIHPLSPNLQVSFGSSFRDVGDTAFTGSTSNQEGNLGFGTAVKYYFPALSVQLAYDYQNINRTLDWRLRNHLGLEVAFPVLKIYGGINQMYLTYGFALDLWILKITAVSYAEELGVQAGQNSDRRYLLHLGLQFTL